MSYNESLSSGSNYPPMSQSQWDGEEWKPCPEFETKYLISNYGRIKSIGTYNTCKTNSIIAQTKKHGRNGYMQVRLHDNGRARTIEVHTLVAKAFIPNPHNYACVNHKNENKTDNRVDNLEWCSNEYNIRYSKPNILMLDLNGNLIRKFNSQSEIV